MSLTTNKNFLQPTGFTFVINRKNYPNLEFFAQSVTHPGASVNPLELPINRITSVPLAGDKITYGQLTLDVMLDEDMTSYKEMQNWLERIVNDGHVPEDKGGKISTYADITLIILTSHNNANRSIRYKDCVPVDIGNILLSSNASDVTYPTFSVGFRFSSFEIN
jgi:hypothetical protein